MIKTVVNLYVDRVLGDLRLEDRARGRAAYAEHLERCCMELSRKRSREELETEWKEIRRGWYLGSTVFREKVEDLVAEKLAGNKQRSYRSETRETSPRWSEGCRIPEAGRSGG